MGWRDRISRAVTRSTRGDRAESPDDSRLYTDVEKAAGGPRQAADYMGVSLRTWERWRDGSRSPNEENEELLKLAARRSRLAPGREDRLRTTDAPSISITGMIGVEGEEGADYVRHRTINVGGYLSEDTMSRVTDAWLNGNDAQAESILRDAVENEYVSDMKIVDIDDIHFGG